MSNTRFNADIAFAAMQVKQMLDGHATGVLDFNTRIKRAVFI
jgi:hypothetical protein